MVNSLRLYTIVSGPWNTGVKFHLHIVEPFIFTFGNGLLLDFQGPPLTIWCSDPWFLVSNKYQYKTANVNVTTKHDMLNLIVKG